MSPLCSPEFQVLLQRMDPTLAAIIRRAGEHFERTSPEERAALQAQYERRERANRMEGMQIPGRIRSDLLSGVDEHGRPLREVEPLQQLRSRVAARRRLIVLAGPVGTGKTYAAARWLADRQSGLFVHCRDVAALSRNWSGDHADLNRVRRTSPLVIDDLGAGVDSDADRGRLEELLCERHQQNLLTIATSNLAPKDVLIAYGERVASRLRDVGSIIGCTKVLRAPEGNDHQGGRHAR